MAHSSVLLWLFLLLISCAATPSTGVTIYIDAERGNDTSGCVTGLSSHSCQSLHYAVTNSHSNITFLLLSDVPLQTVINFTSRHNITISGAHKQLLCDEQKCDKTDCGLLFENCVNLTLENIGVKFCGMLRTIPVQGEIIQIRSGIIINNGNCSTTLHQINASENNGYGALVLDTVGVVNIYNSTFSFNKNTSQDAVIGGGGLSIVVSCARSESMCLPTEKIYVIQESKFHDNQMWWGIDLFPFWKLSYGGGLNVDFGLNTTKNILFIEACVFSNNVAVYGGGMYVGFNSSNSSLLAHNSSFESNKAERGCGLFIDCEYGCNHNTVSINSSKFEANSLVSNDTIVDEGGGGLFIEIESGKNVLPIGNKFKIVNCNFTKNKAWFGAGTSVLCGQQIGNFVENQVHFIGCSWNDNISPVSPAVDVFPGVLFPNQTQHVVTVTFTDCDFRRNVVNQYYDVDAKSGRRIDLPMKQNTGIFLAMQVPVYFSGNTHFESNTGTALLAASSVVTFVEGSDVQFWNNSGEFGGALSLVGFSLLQYEDNITFNFTDNMATLGGAINVHSSDQHLNVASYNCFLLFANLFERPINVTFYFHNNSALLGRDIYMTSTLACERVCSVQVNNPYQNSSNLFVNGSCFGDFIFEPPLLNYSASIASEGMYFKLRNGIESFVITPGMPYDIPIDVFDNFNYNVTEYAIYTAQLASNCSHFISIDPAFTSVADNTIKILGVPNENCTLVLTTIRGSLTTQVDIQFNLTWCRPGYVLQPNSQEGSCVCSASLAEDYQYNGITACNITSSVAIIEPGLWVGYGNETHLTHDNLFTAPCPPPYCISNLTMLNVSAELLNGYICQKNRHGLLCGECKNGTSVFFNDYRPSCKKDRSCRLGPLLYIVCELLPITVVFMIIILADISLTSGEAYNAVFLAQILSAVFLSFNDTVFIKPFKYLGYIYGIVDLSYEFHSFCFWSGANALQMKAMKYVSLLYAVGLVIVTVLLFKQCTCSCSRINRYLHRRARRITTVQGLTAFLVICYSQCAQTSFELLTSATVSGIGNQYFKTVVFYGGSLSYFSPEHLTYAIPALLILVIIVFPFPLLLFCDPFLLKLESCLVHHQALKPTCLPWTRLRMKFKPFLDSFQGCFRDDARYFSGLFFFYRTLIFITSTRVKNLIQYNTYMETLLLVMLTVQAIFQPFEKWSHNIISSCVFTVLLLMNTFTAHVYSLVISRGDHVEIFIFQCLQILLCCLPILVGLVACGKWFLKKILKRKDDTSAPYVGSLLLSRSVAGSYSPLQDRARFPQD